MEDLFSRTSSTSAPAPPAIKSAQLSAIFKDNPNIQKYLTDAEKSAVKAVIENVGTPDEYPSAAEYVLRALPFVKSVYSRTDVIQPLFPSDQEIAIMMRSRFLN